ncbi:MAG TPA: HNH endonuclease [Phycicoccus elongatus]|nr:HNH endonuclease [Phycicoccus elongatus]
MTIARSISDEFVRREIIAAALLRRADETGGYVTWDELARFPLPDGSVERLVDPGRGGIWNPSAYAATLTIITSPDGPYPDREIDGGLLQYSYQKGPDGGKNLKLEAAMTLGLPVIRLNKVAKNAYNPIYPVFVVGNNPIAREFTLTVDEVLRVVPGQVLSPIEKAYAARTVQQRVHQPAFRARVMLAYEGQCTVCTLKHPELLDAAHIIEDGQPGGDPIVTNGLSLCKIHHAAYDRQLMGISPDYLVQINTHLLHEIDGPMLRHGLQEMHGRTLTTPIRRQDRPDPERLHQRYTRFLAG